MMNSKTEQRGYKIPRIVVEKDQRDAKKEVELEESIDRSEEAAMQLLREKNLSKPNNHSNCSRKRAFADMMPEGAKGAKKLKFVAPDPNVNTISVAGEKWDAGKSKFKRKLSAKGSIES